VKALAASGEIHFRCRDTGQWLGVTVGRPTGGGGGPVGLCSQAGWLGCEKEKEEVGCHGGLGRNEN
jgi:hypothetical protein